MKATIKDVAELAGVSFKTVSRVINKEGSVKPETLKKVNDAIAQLNYQPNTAARNLAGTTSFALGFVYDNPNAYYVIDMQNGILDECRDKGYELIIHPCSATSQNIIAEITDMVKRSQLAGLIISPPISEMPEVLSALDQLNIHYVRIISGSDESKEHSPCVFIHDKEAAANIIEHLISQGHQRIAFISGDKDHRSSDERKQGYLDALARHGIEFNPAYLYDGSYSFETGVEGAKYLLGLDEPPTAIFSCNDEIAAGALFAARLQGVDVPCDMAIAGFEDSPFSRQTWPKLTTAAQPTNEIARKAASGLIQHLIGLRSGRNKTAAIPHQHFQPTLLVRESTLKEACPEPEL
ncbi:LacI family DNA-binding transcriptional regulator [Aestuariibacter halophilus]|uniref:LacI family DNA-binding transcriptional regulator n=1 Tax=Fluctibacter halophilus TaxID=226011 RepID=A0ABS8G9I8_9ALTE|nr:LacI family DNA-binding transcriptional regulator [Aestuariibacter halophilus]MCC2617215.1 LacI family DNA-binding transcriptional regulator [Aestuariibacter halophilus]